ncbi:tetratricopeptide repeat protein [Aureispira anguillae]|uniref:Tetratricopeptide repeat-containing protein n=1 Tax=Aureispira anguillae TaxID=2864201 RepID=A0A915YBT1_9BACT|nr:hypothetical protein [Aureispira anguillae]BDS10185.1 hypothetical protein AsAng_0008930 [Aureispira anguillae]
MTEEQQFEQIERYLNQQLTKEETKAFEQLIAKDSALAQEVTLHQEMAAFLSDQQAFDLEKKLSAIGEDFSKMHQKSATTSTRKWYYWLAAASFLLILTFAWWYNQAEKTSQELFAAHYQTYISDELERSTPHPLSDHLTTGINAYIQKDYKVAIEQLQQALQIANTPNNSHENILFHLAMSNIELKNYALAKGYLNQVLTLNKSIYAQQSYWYLALIELQEGNRSNSKMALEQLLRISERGKYALQAKQLLQEL